MLPTVRMLSLTMGKIVSRDHFKILPMPASVILRMNKLAAKDGRADSTDIANTTPPPPHTPDYFTPSPSDDSTTGDMQEPLYYQLADEAGILPHLPPHAENVTGGRE